MEELKGLLREEKELITMLEGHLSRAEGMLENVSGMREDFQELFSIFKVFIQKQETFMQAFIDKKA